MGALTRLCLQRVRAAQSPPGHTSQPLGSLSVHSALSSLTVKSGASLLLEEEPQLIFLRPSPEAPPSERSLWFPCCGVGFRDWAGGPMEPTGSGQYRGRMLLCVVMLMWPNRHGTQFQLYHLATWDLNRSPSLP